jgi:hypothetical protein
MAKTMNENIREYVKKNYNVMGKGFTTDQVRADITELMHEFFSTNVLARHVLIMARVRWIKQLATISRLMEGVTFTGSSIEKYIIEVESMLFFLTKYTPYTVEETANNLVSQYELTPEKMLKTTMIEEIQKEIDMYEKNMAAANENLQATTIPMAVEATEQRDEDEPCQDM